VPSFLESNGVFFLNEAPHSAMLEYICDVLPFAVARIKKTELQTGPSTSNLNLSYTCFRVT